MKRTAGKTSDDELFPIRRVNVAEISLHIGNDQVAENNDSLENKKRVPKHMTRVSKKKETVRGSNLQFLPYFDLTHKISVHQFKYFNTLSTV